MSDKKTAVTYNKISTEPSQRLGAPIDEVLERRKQSLAKFRSGK